MNPAHPDRPPPVPLPETRGEAAPEPFQGAGEINAAPPRLAAKVAKLIKRYPARALAVVRGWLRDSN